MKTWLEYDHRNVQYMYTYLYMHMLKTAQEIVNSLDGKTYFSLYFSMVSIFTLYVYYIFKNSENFTWYIGILLLPHINMSLVDSRLYCTSLLFFVFLSFYCWHYYKCLHFFSFAPPSPSPSPDLQHTVIYVCGLCTHVL